jgi:molybdopterin-guanine dinucleotide biosynthesis protein
MMAGMATPWVVSVSGTCSRAGKTALAEAVLRAWPSRTATAVKFTVTDEIFECCPRGTACAVCDIDVPFRMVDDPATLDEAGTDTARLGAAGARQVLWMIARQSAAAEAWRAVARRLPSSGLVVLEGSTVVPLVAPALRLFVVHPFLSPQRWKPTTPALVKTSHAVIVNRPAAERRPPSPDVLAALAPLLTQELRIADLAEPLASWAPDLTQRLQQLLEAARPTGPARATTLVLNQPRTLPPR